MDLKEKHAAYYRHLRRTSAPWQIGSGILLIILSLVDIAMGYSAIWYRSLWIAYAAGFVYLGVKRLRPTTTASATSIPKTLPPHEAGTPAGGPV